MAADIENFKTYQQLITTANLTPDQQAKLQTLTNQLRDKILSSQDINLLQDCITNLETFFLNQTSSYISGMQDELSAELQQFTYSGIWNSATSYKQWNVVTYQGQSYLALLPNTNTPVSNTTYWSLIAAQGAVGPAGAELAYIGEYSSTTTYQQNELVTFNGSTYVCLQNNTQNQLPTNTTYWTLFVSGVENIYINVKDYGAVGDGVQDDTAAIQAALNAVSSSPFGVVYFAPGTYLVSSTLIMGGGVRLVGAGIYASTIKLANGANCDVIQTPNDGTLRQGAEISQLCIDGNGSNQTAGDSVINIYSCSYFTLHHCYVKNPYNHGVHIGALPQNTAQISIMPRIHDNMIYGAQNVSLGHGILLEGHSSDGMIHDNDIGWFDSGAGVYLSAHNGAYVATNNAWQCLNGYHTFLADRLRMVGNLSDLANQDGFVVQESNQIHLSACQAKDSGQAGSGHDGFLIQGTSGNICNDITISNCQAFSSVSSGGLSILSYANNVSVTCCDFAQASGAVFVGTTGVTNIVIEQVLGYSYGQVNVKYYGAKGDGTTDDTAAIQNAINASSTGSIIFFPAGTYITTGTLTFLGDRTYQGTGWDSVIMMVTGGTFTPMITTSQTVVNSHMIIKDLLVDANSANSASRDILHLYNIQFSYFDHVRAQNCNGACFYLDQANGKLTNTVHLNDCYGYYGDSGLTISGGSDVQVLDGDYGYNYTYGINLSGSSCSVKNAVVWGSRATNGVGILVNGIANTIADCNIEGNAGHGINVSGYADHTTIIGNKIYDNGNLPANYGLYDGIYVNGTSGNIATNITILNNNIFAGVYAAGQSGGPTGYYRFGINLDTYHQNCTVNGNNVSFALNNALFNNANAINGISVGDILDGTLIVYNVPTNPVVAPSLTAGAGSTALAAGTYDVSYSLANAAGQTSASPTSSITITAGQHINVGAITLPTGITSVNYFLSDAAGSTTLKFVLNGTGAATSLTQLPITGALVAPTVNSTRPPSAQISSKCYDQSISKPIVYSGSAWTDYTGAIV